MVEEMTLTTKSPVETRRLGEALGEILKTGDIILLSGDLGAGKTTFSKGVAQGAGVRDEVTSPTYTLAVEYEGRVPLVHMDLYRVGDELQSGLSGLGFDDYLESDNALLIEWPQGVEETLPDTLQIRIDRAPMPRLDERVFHCKATGARSWELLDEWVKQWLF